MPLSDVSKVLRLSSESFDDVVDTVCRILSSGGVVALPTDTLYGLTSTLEHSQALFALKHRSCSKPLGLFVSSASDVTKWAESTVSASVLHTLLPGPVTLLFNRLPSLPDHFNPSTRLVGVRVPACPLVQAVTERLNVPLAQTSANVSGAQSPTCIDDFEELIPKIDLIVDGGRIGYGTAGSTVVDLSEEGEYGIVREGCAREETEDVLRGAGLRPRL